MNWCNSTFLSLHIKYSRTSAAVHRFANSSRVKFRKHWSVSVSPENTVGTTETYKNCVNFTLLLLGKLFRTRTDTVAIHLKDPKKQKLEEQSRGDLFPHNRNQVQRKKKENNLLFLFKQLAGKGQICKTHTSQTNTKDENGQPQHLNRNPSTLVSPIVWGWKKPRVLIRPLILTH